MQNLQKQETIRKKTVYNKHENRIKKMQKMFTNTLKCDIIRHPDDEWLFARILHVSMVSVERRMMAEGGCFCTTDRISGVDSRIAYNKG